MNIFLDLVTPISLFFIVFLIGHFIGKIRLFSISLDQAAILIVAIFAGYILSKYAPSILTTEFNSGLSVLLKLGTSLFIATIGLSSGEGFERKNLKKSLLFFVLGGGIVLSGFLAMKIIGLADQSMDRSLLGGIFCGAMTSTPGLSALCETTSTNSKLATIGYGGAYLIGVTFTIIGTQLLKEKNKGAFLCSQENAPQTKNSSIPIKTFLILSIVALGGQLIGFIKIPMIQQPIGATVGTLLSGILVCKLFSAFQNEKAILFSDLHIYRELGLLLFYFGNGISAGQHLQNGISIKIIIYAAIIAIVAILIAIFLGWFFLKKDIKNRLFLLAGGMTSTPALGVVLKNAANSIDTYAYSNIYIGALITILFYVKYLK